MALSNRDKLLTTLLPAVVVVAAYGFVFMKAKRTEVERAQKDLDANRGRPTTAAQMAEDRLKLLTLANDIGTETRTIEELRKKWTAAGRSVEPLSRPERIQRLNQLLDEHGLRVIDGADLEASKGSTSAASMDGVARELGDACGYPPPRTRVVRFRGRYVETAHALRAISRGAVLAVPIGLTMATDPADPERLEWTLHVWV